MQNKKLVILIIVSILAIISLIYGIFSSPKKRYVDNGLEVYQLQKKEVIPLKRSVGKTAFTSWGRNPFILKEVREKKKAELALNGILWDKDNPKAVINDAIVGVGDSIGENKIVSIEQDHVILNDGTSDIKLELWEEGKNE